MSDYTMDYQFQPMETVHIDGCIVLIEDAFKKNIGELSHQYESTQKTEPPWSWFRQDHIKFFVLTHGDSIVAYVIWRNLPHVSYLHSFLVAAGYQGKGIGRSLLDEYERMSRSINTDTRLLTLHTYEETVYNHIFYQKSGYRKYESGDEGKVPWLEEWIHNCKAHDDWPLNNGRVLFYKEYGR